jgi:hypothetical protein
MIFTAATSDIFQWIVPVGRLVCSHPESYDVDLFAGGIAYLPSCPRLSSFASRSIVNDI